ncbi:hypothetical protein [Rhodococcus sp. AQ5-07]|uniref:hypothetical protein n=1 Tax=Rhodococcus sp. AQ5-07 TaxID=2054902 RepID=UPI0012B5C8CA|nr:hypothetical protein [Rhodococcus sp. AQ5-07]
MPAAPETVASYLAEAGTANTGTDTRLTYSPATLRRWVAVINFFHRVAEAPPPSVSQLVASTLAGLQRKA